ncbi:dTDP-4-dehydrorhamnose 3,5-epimerase family protein [Egicoccus halophilus]|uniref:dTDP-4-dehydrorhamnose 3,5-epimerase n=1 Tax=Egicoccus halophilus TaxID=1670830 RepID=A0A8J3A8C2_9ACTN|nr:dTDP-4-dehydrorhamnose 3,5-epimerase family protein [Egicoccus halophilus]GGI04015.1 dTDP-4-dehydrorhamnose 3,5-epimerase [Egicoccus halophilus]
MTVRRTDIEGLLVVSWPVHEDGRGFFRQTYQRSELEEALGRPVAFRQGNHARSAPGVLRGFHAEPWDKLVQVVRGRAMAAIADIRPESPTFGQVRTFELGDGVERIRLFVAAGLANSYCTHGDDDVDYLYDVTEEWYPGADKRAVAWDDPDLAVAWPVARPQVSEADRANPTLRERFPDHPAFASATPRRRDRTGAGAHVVGHAGDEQESVR